MPALGPISTSGRRTIGPSRRSRARLLPINIRPDENQFHTGEAIMFSYVFLLLLQVTAVLCNTEKVIFLGPSSLQVPVEHPTLGDLKLEALSPLSWSLRTHIQAEFPTNSSQYGQSSWYLLHKLQEGQRYEVRICWAATVSLFLKWIRSSG
jgi:hypothetical protein